MRPATEIAHFAGGFVAAEGSFTVSSDHRTFTFAVGLGAIDKGMCEMLKTFLGVGRLSEFGRRRAHYDDEVAIVVRALPELVHVVVPFMDAHLPASHKRAQYQAWRAELLGYWEHQAKRIRPCSVDECERPRRAKGLCRSHYYAAYQR